MKDLCNEIKENLLKEGASDVGFCRVKDGPEGFDYAVSIVVKLSDAVIDEITDLPTQTYYHHYRTVNTLIDLLEIKAGQVLERFGCRYIPVPASQTVNTVGMKYAGRYSHKKLSTLAGLGSPGKHSLFIHRRFGPRVRLGSVFFCSPVALPIENQPIVNSCVGCDLCVSACPAGAISGRDWAVGVSREELFDAKACSESMKERCMHIGRGSVCGICVKVCPQTNTNLNIFEE